MALCHKTMKRESLIGIYNDAFAAWLATELKFWIICRRLLVNMVCIKVRIHLGYILYHAFCASFIFNFFLQWIKRANLVCDISYKHTKLLYSIKKKKALEVLEDWQMKLREAEISGDNRSRSTPALCLSLWSTINLPHQSYLSWWDKGIEVYLLSSSLCRPQIHDPQHDLIKKLPLSPTFQNMFDFISSTV